MSSQKQSALNMFWHDNATVSKVRWIQTWSTKVGTEELTEPQPQSYRTHLEWAGIQRFMPGLSACCSAPFVSMGEWVQILTAMLYNWVKKHFKKIGRSYSSKEGATPC